MNGSDRHSLAEPNPNPYASPQVEGLTAATPKADWSPPAGPLTDGIRVSGTMNWQDFKRAQKLHFGIRRPIVICLLLMLAAACVLGLYADLPVWLCVWPAAIAIGMALAIARFRQAHLVWRKYHLEGRPYERVFAEEGVQSNTPESSHTMRWTFFTKHRRSTDMLLLYWDPPLIFWFFPRRQFESDADWQAAVELIARKVPGG